MWIPEERFYEAQNLYDPEVYQGFKDEITDAVKAVHGELTRPKTPGHASGTWTADVSPWVLAWSPGVEWDPVSTAASDAANAQRGVYEGTYFSATADATPTESWLAEMLDHLAGEEASRGVTMPLTFTNWPTTDPLTHPYEPMENEDMVGVDANHIHPTEAWSGGYFASYHAYPYYPDFQRHEPELLTVMRDGTPDPYAGYLRSLREHHAGIPLVVTEFGVPSSSGMAHFGPVGRDQGDHSEQEQMALDADMLRTISEAGCSGGYVFEWADEWFKFTWNTIEYELPGDRRDKWRNALTNEEHFGLLSVEPGAEGPTVTVDGDVGEWDDNASTTIYEGRGAVRRVRAVKDEGYLYLHIEQRLPQSVTGEAVVLGFDVLEGGNLGLPLSGDAGDRLRATTGADPEADYAVVLRPDGTADAYVRGSNDQFDILWGKVQKRVAYQEADLATASGAWHRWRLLVNRQLVIPATGEELGVETFDAGALRKGTSDPQSDAFDSRTAWATSGADIEVRLPWMLIGYADPSSKQALSITDAGDIRAVDALPLGISVAVGEDLAQTGGYDWEGWEAVSWHERLKAGSGLYRQAVEDVQR